MPWALNQEVRCHSVGAMYCPGWATVWGPATAKSHRPEAMQRRKHVERHPSKDSKFLWNREPECCGILL